MKAAVVTKYGGPEVVKIIDTNKPTPKQNEILVKVKAVTVTAGDSRIRGSHFPKGFKIPGRMALGIFSPRVKILGSEFSGIIEQIGVDVKEFKVGDEVMGFRVFNVHAEYVCIKESKALVIKPKNLTFEQAAAIPFGGSTALFFLNKANIQPGQTILANGSSGAVGSMAVQIAKSMGAKVTSICSTKNIELVKSLGADTVIDYTKEDLLKSNKSYNVIINTVGNLDFKDVEKYLSDNGKFLQLVAGLKEIIFGQKGANGKKLITGTAPEKKEDLLILKKLAEENKIKAVIGKEFDFKDIVEAHRYADSGHKVGSVVVRV